MSWPLNKNCIAVPDSTARPILAESCLYTEQTRRMNLFKLFISFISSYTSKQIITSLPVGVQSIAINVCMSVCPFVSVCLSVLSHISKITRPDFTKFSVRYLWPWLGPSLATVRYRAGDRCITAENMEKSQHIDFNEDTTNECTIVWHVVPNGGESWTLRKNEETRLDAFEMKGLRKILSRVRGQKTKQNK